MQPQLVLDDELINEALNLTGMNNKSELVYLALKDLIQNRQKKDLFQLAGQIELDKAYDYKASQAEIVILMNELVVANQELVFQNTEKEKRAAELVVANQELVFQNAEKEKRAAELIVANQELVFQNAEKEKRAAELVVANQELVFQNAEKEKRAAELVVANQELVFQDDEKAKRATELVITTALLQAQSQYTAELIIANEKLRLSLAETITLARKLGEMRDPYTTGHEESVGNLAAAISAELGFDLNFQEGIRISGYLHDLGKIIIPSEILSKPAKLSFEEFSLIKNHVEAGYDALKEITFPWPIARAVREHHERMDGSGYPQGLKGEEISIEGRILAVADVVDAIFSHRPYRPGLGIEAALNEIKLGSGIHYDTTVVNACIKLFREQGYKISEPAEGGKDTRAVLYAIQR